MDSSGMTSRVLQKDANGEGQPFDVVPQLLQLQHIEDCCRTSINRDPIPKKTEVFMRHAAGPSNAPPRRYLNLDSPRSLAPETNRAAQQLMAQALHGSRRASREGWKELWLLR